MKRAFGVLVGAAIAAMPMLAFGQEVPAVDAYQTLTDDPSRDALFTQYVEPARAEELAEANKPPDSFAFAGNFAFPHSALFDDLNHGAKRPPDAYYFGIDLNHYKSTKVEYDQLASANVLFVYVKATQGVGFKDANFDNYWDELSKLGKPGDAQFVYRGAYHFLSAGPAGEAAAAADGKAQADSFYKYVKAHGGWREFDLPPCVDLEWDATKTNPDRWKGHDPKDIVAEVLGFLKEIEMLTGKKPMIYTARSWWNSITNKSTRPLFEQFAGYTLWPADYSKSSQAAEIPLTPLDKPWVVWQFTAKASVPQLSPDKEIDASAFKGTLASFKQQMGLAD